MNPRVVGDTALYLEPDEYSYDASGRVAICLRDEGKKWGKGSDYIDSVVQVCNAHSSEYEYVLPPFYPVDRELHQDLGERIRNAVVKDFTDPIDIQGVLAEIAKTDAMIGEKLHASVLSACCHVPMISLEYRAKNEDFMSHLGLEELNIRINEVSTDSLSRLFDKTVSNDDIQKHLQHKHSDIRTDLEQFSGQIRRSINVGDQ